MKKTKNDKKKKGGVIGRSTLYSVISAHSKPAILRLVELMSSKNENVALGASKAILSKTIPDLKVTELKGDEDRPVGVVFLPKKDYERLDSPPRATKGSIKKD